MSTSDSFCMYAAAWLDRASGHLTPRTVLAYRRTIRYQLADLADIEIACVTRRVARDLLAELARRYASATVHRAHAVLALILDDAVEDEVMPGNPARGVRRPRLWPVRRLVIPDPETVVRILAAAAAIVPDRAPLFTALARGGLRVGEGRGLWPEDCDFGRGLLHVNRSAHVRGVTDLPKGKRRRVVPMSATLRVALLEATRRADTWLFPGRFGAQAPIGYSVVRRDLDAVTTTIGAPRITPHALRHFFASYMRVEGADLLWVRDTCGHSSVRITEHYSGHFVASRPAILDRT